MSDIAGKTQGELDAQGVLAAGGGHQPIAGNGSPHSPRPPTGPTTLPPQPSELERLERERDSALRSLKESREREAVALRSRDEALADVERATKAFKDALAHVASERDGARAEVVRLREALEDVRDDLEVMRTTAHADAVEACGAKAESTIAAALATSSDARPRIRSLADYQVQAARTLRRAHPDHPEFDARREHSIAVMGLGIAGEAGEVADYLKKVLGHGHELDLMALAKELGDVLWYVAALATMHHLRLEDIAALNINKLRARFPNGFTESDSKARVDVAPDSVVITGAQPPPRAVLVIEGPGGLCQPCRAGDHSSHASKQWGSICVGCTCKERP